jgi:hypothetical protein
VQGGGPDHISPTIVIRSPRTTPAGVTLRKPGPFGCEAAGEAVVMTVQPPSASATKHRRET